MTIAPARSRPVSRRGLVHGMAWCAPTIVVETAAPALAVSPQACAPQTLAWTSIGLYNGATTTIGRTTVTVGVSGAAGAPNNGTTGTLGGISNSLLLYSPTQTSSSAQTVSLSFSSPVSQVKLTLSDIDTDPGYYQDRVTVSPGATVTSIGSGTRGAGTTASPFLGVSSVGDTTPNGNVGLTWSGSVSKVSLTYDQAIVADGITAPRIGVSAVTFTPSTC